MEKQRQIHQWLLQSRHDCLSSLLRAIRSTVTTSTSSSFCTKMRPRTTLRIHVHLHIHQRQGHRRRPWTYWQKQTLLYAIRLYGPDWQFIVEVPPAAVRLTIKIDTDDLQHPPHACLHHRTATELLRQAQHLKVMTILSGLGLARNLDKVLLTSRQRQHILDEGANPRLYGVEEEETTQRELEQYRSDRSHAESGP
jgi:hypothetical protein